MQASNFVCWLHCAGNDIYNLKKMKWPGCGLIVLIFFTLIICHLQQLITFFRFFRVWQDVPVLVIVSMLAYFCFLEQLLVSLAISKSCCFNSLQLLILSCEQVGKLKSGAIALSLPFSCILGLLASMASTTMGSVEFLFLFSSNKIGY